MRTRRIIAIAVVLTLLAVGIPRPRPARADTSTDVELAFIALGAYVVFIVGCTWLVNRSPSPESQAFAAPPLNRTAAPGAVHTVARCAQRGPGLTLVCW